MATPSERKVGYQQEPDDHRMSEPLDLDGDGEDDTIIAQDAAGAANVLGGGEFPDPDTPPRPPAPGSVDEAESPEEEATERER